MPDIHKMNEDLSRLIAQHRAGRTPDADQFGAIHKRAVQAAKEAEADDDTDATERALSIADTAKAHQELAAQLEKPLPRAAAPSNPSSTFGPSGSSEAVMTNWVDRRTGRAVPVLGKGQRLADIVPGANEASMGRLITGIVTGQWGGLEREQALATNNNASGGYLVDDMLSARIIDMSRNKSVLSRLGAQTVVMPTGNVTIARVSSDPDIESKSENSAFTGSEIGFDAITLNSHTLGCVVTLSRELFDDAVNAAAVVEQVLSAKLAQRMDHWFLSGTGSAEPLGVFNNPNVQEISSVGSVVYDDLLDGLEDLEVANASPNGIVMPPALSTVFRKATIASESNHFATPPAAIADLTWLTSNQVPAETIFMADFTQILLGIRQQAMIETSTDAGDSFSKHQVRVKVTFRGDANVEHADHLLKLTGATA